MSKNMNKLFYLIIVIAMVGFIVTIHKLTRNCYCFCNAKGSVIDRLLKDFWDTGYTSKDVVRGN